MFSGGLKTGFGLSGRIIEFVDLSTDDRFVTSATCKNDTRDIATKNAKMLMIRVNVREPQSPIILALHGVAGGPVATE